MIELAATDLGGVADAPLLLVGPSLGTSVATLWRPVADALADRFHVVGWDLPGHAPSGPATGFDLPALAAAVGALADEFGAPAFHYAGDSIGGAVGLQLLVDAPARVRSAVLACTAPHIASEPIWHERAELVRTHGTAALLDAAPGRWFGPGFAERDPATVRQMLDDLAAVDADSYAAACVALAAFDLRGRLAPAAAPVTLVGGVCDLVIPVADVRAAAEELQAGFVALDGVAHVAPVEAPVAVTSLITSAAARPGLEVRREVLGDAHVDRAIGATTEFTAAFQDLITRYAWGGVWTRPGLDRRTRSLITLTALVARGHTEEFAMHVRAARRNGVTVDELREVLLHAAIYCGVPDANTAFRIAQRVLDEEA